MGFFSPTRMIMRMVVATTVCYAGSHILADAGPKYGASPQTFSQMRGEHPDPAHVPAGAQAAVVARNIDGDTIAVYVASPGPLPRGREITVRLLEIDTPETKKPGAPVACGGPAASAFTAHLLPPGTKVALVPDREATDRYGRALRYVYTATTMANLAIARAGYARELLFEPNDAHIAQVRSAVAGARSAGRGMWAACADPFTPVGS